MGKRAWTVLIGLAAVVAFAVFVLPGLLFRSFFGGFAGWGDSDRLESGLTYISVAAFVADVSDVQAIALYDEGRSSETPQWYIIADPKDAAEAEFGFPKSRFLDALAGQHITTYCGSHGVLQGKVVWALSAGKVAKARVYCARRRMDLRQLIPLAKPVVEIERDDLTADAYTALEARIAGSDSMWSSLRSQIEPYSHQCAVQFPYIWSAPEVGRRSIMARLEEAVEAEIAATLDVETYHLEIRSGYASSYVMHPEEGSTTSAEGWAVDTPFVWLQDAGEVRKAPGISVYQPQVRVKSTEAACQQIEAMDFDTMLAEGRDQALLAQVWAAGVAMPKIGGSAAPQVSALRQGGVQITPTAEITYRLRYFEVAPTEAE